MNNERIKDILLLLLRFAVGNDNAECAEKLKTIAHGEVDWEALIKLSVKQGVAVIAHDGFRCSGMDKDSCCKLNGNDRAIRRVKLSWVGLSLPVTSTYEKQHKIINHLASLYAQHGVKMMLIKGYGVSLNYPIPNHRRSSDIDIYCFEQHDLSNKIIEEQGIKVDYSEHKHTTFKIKGVTIENHYSFLNTHGHLSTAETEQILEQIIREEPPLQVENFFVPTPNFNVIYLLRHMAENFATAGTNLRQLLDWSLFVKHYHNEIDWQMCLNAIDKVGMRSFLDIVIAISVDYLGFDKSLFPEYKADKKLVERCLNDMLVPEFADEHPSNIFAEILYKLRRWKSNIWKHGIVYKENIVMSFMTQTWSHLMKPSSIAYGMKG